MGAKLSNYQRIDRPDSLGDVKPATRPSGDLCYPGGSRVTVHRKSDFDRWLEEERRRHEELLHPDEVIVL